jgi:hypothetical protein
LLIVIFSTIMVMAIIVIAVVVHARHACASTHCSSSQQAFEFLNALTHFK